MPPQPVPADSQERQKTIVLLLVGVVYSVGVAYLFASLPNQRFTDDFFPRWYASKMLLDTGRSLYDWANATELVSIVGWPLAYQLGYYYPAYLLVFTAPLAMIPYPAARFIWTAFGLWCLWAGVWLFARTHRPVLSLNRLTLLLVLVTTSVPVLQHTLNAQFNTPGVLALALTYRALCRQKYLPAGLWAGGLLFKPQATLVPLVCLLVWTALKPARRWFWVGLGVISLAFWGIAELLEPGWVAAFLHTLGQYEPTASVLDRLWNPYQGVSLALLAATIWLTFRARQLPVTSPQFSGLLAWAVSLNCLAVPLFGMLHMVLAAVPFILLLDAVRQVYPGWTGRVWAGTVALFVAGLAAFAVPLALQGISGLQITAAEAVYKISMPTVSVLAALGVVINKGKRQQDL